MCSAICVRVMTSIFGEEFADFAVVAIDADCELGEEGVVEVGVALFTL